MSASPSLHVVPNRFGRWRVLMDGQDEPLSEHDSATDAERDALRRASTTGCHEVVVHDRYGRLHRSEVPVGAAR